MMQEQWIPCLPENAPFTVEQRAYLNGFLAGLFSRAPMAQPAEAMVVAPALRPLVILFGSQTGTSETLAKRTAKETGKHGFAATVYDMREYPPGNLAKEENVLIITSTYGDGEPPDNARGLWEYLSAESCPSLRGVKFAVLALGDSSYPQFCECGKNFDARLEKLGATRIFERVDCDLEYEQGYQRWLGGCLSALRGQITPASGTGLEAGANGVADRIAGTGWAKLQDPAPGAVLEAREISMAGEAVESKPIYSRTNPFPARLMTNVKLNGTGSDKDTRHFEFALEGSAFEYEAGDALGVIPRNCVELVDELLRALGASGEEPVAGRDAEEVSLREALMGQYEITKISSSLLNAMAEQTDDGLLRKLTAPGVNGELTQFLWGREVIDLLLEWPQAKFSAMEFVGLLKKLQPRLYSISSSPKAHASQVHLTVAVVRYQSLGRRRKGVCSTYLAERAAREATVPVFAHVNNQFRLPVDGNVPVIMVGPGTGIAPFRAFLEERRACGASGRNWLFFGDQHAASDFLYGEELMRMQTDGTLRRLDVAFSRDQEEKVYVQHKMIEHARELYGWLESGAHFYVCGDAKRMARDVDKALHEVIQKASGCTEERAAEYVRALQASRRYQRDVY